MIKEKCKCILGINNLDPSKADKPKLNIPRTELKAIKNYNKTSMIGLKYLIQR